ncbi:hypothetical protein GCM10009841_27590 [Microlunatus panaciterrae]|uniref:Signal transduction histidine kinase n=1 Tax=Microlunatus panaciterrae TaxID=400768 RepID=A0ABS2RIF9_9ACTN|nr:hypothetical protein [Microlunatus panaciterrae]MBM7798357.1 hypothetical protein [Microlunatus panaciterrae]
MLTHEQRRDRLAYLAVLRQVSTHTRRASLVRLLAALVIAGIASFGGMALVAVPLALMVAVTSLLDYLNAWHEEHGTTSRLRLVQHYADTTRAVSGMQQMNLGGLIGTLSSPLLVIIASWLLTDLPGPARLVALATAIVYVCSVAGSIFKDHSWFNPEGRPPAWQEIVRLGAGPVACALIAVIALPAPWTDSELLAVWVLVLTPFTIQVRIWDHDQLLRGIGPLVRDEAYEGRSLVLREIHGSLSTQLRLLEQYARRLKAEEPVLYELAVSANSRLRETLMLREADRMTATTTDTLAAPVLTLARAVGASATATIEVTELAEEDRDLARLTLNDLVGNAINAGAAEVHTVVRKVGDQIEILVSDDAAPMTPGVWKTPGTSSARLEARLVELGGGLDCVQGEQVKTVTARWTELDGG